MRNIGNRIKEKRIEMGLSQEELARKAGYASRSSIQKIEDSRGVPAKSIKDIIV
ncbi:MAG: helix-turn-helix domain-containing protein [Lachnospiraceae bacterium]|nr:helix-turn-helix domain-containing protein [Lachnospiraceae bacterium]